MNFTQLRERNHKWFLDYILISKYINKHDYFGTFRFREDQDMTWEQSQKSISHFKNTKLPIEYWIALEPDSNISK